MHQEAVRPKLALIVGGAGGIGRATASLLAREDFSVVIADLPAAVAHIPSESQSDACLSIGVDLLSRESIREMYTRIAVEWSALDVLVNCAGTIKPAPSEEADELAWDQLLSVHLTGTFRCCQEALPFLRASEHGSIVNVGSILGRRGVSRRASYGAAKAGLEGLTRVLAVEWAHYGVRVNCVVPGYTLTPMNVEAVRVGNLNVDLLSKRIPLGRLAAPGDIASAIVFLASSGAAYITGQELVVDGGLTISGDGWSED